MIRAMRHSLHGSVDWNIIKPYIRINTNKVTPFTGVWIEILLHRKPKIRFRKSLPSRECGLKLYLVKFESILLSVTPFTGVWIEINHATDPCGGMLCSHSLHGSVDWNIFSSTQYITALPVTPFTGVWIEILPPIGQPKAPHQSLPSRECGLKSLPLRLTPSCAMSLPSRECGLK